MEVSFYGGAGEVGRSSIEVFGEKKHLLLDCGIKLGAETEVPQINDALFARSKNIVITHAHLDHIGYLPHLFERGQSPALYATKPTFALMELLLDDYWRISGSFSKKTVKRVMNAGRIIPFLKKVNEKRVPSFSLHNAGHILGSAMVEISDNGGLIYTGDFRLREGRLMQGCEKRLRAKTLIMEGTYGAKADKLPSIKRASSDLANSVRKTLEGGGSVLIPSFAVGRGQEIMLVLEDYMRSGFLPAVPIYVDGMIRKANAIYSKYTDFLRPELHRRTNKSMDNPFESRFFFSPKKQNRAKMLEEPSIIISTSGMLSGGPALEYLRLMAGNKKNKLIFVGYQAEGTLGRRIQDGEKFVLLDGEECYISLDVESVHFSAHADHDDLVEFARGTRGLKKIFLVHGEGAKLHELMADLKNFEVIIPEISETFRV